MRLTAAIFACLCALPAVAAEDLSTLDLSLPQASPYRNDPPGTWYGDRSGVPATAAPANPARRPACPTGPDGEARAVTGSVSTGVGYSSRLGSSTYNILFILGLTCAVTPGGVTLDEPSLFVDLGLAAAAAVLCVPVFYSGRRVSRGGSHFFHSVAS